jgi:hypothetical protein
VLAALAAGRALRFHRGHRHEDAVRRHDALRTRLAGELAADGP